VLAPTLALASPNEHAKDVPAAEAAVAHERGPRTEGQASPAAEKPGKTGKAIPAGPTEKIEPSPPSLSSSAVCDELRRAARDRKQSFTRLEEERASLAKERTRLEKLAADIAKTREALREETARLEAILEKGGSALASAGPVAATDARTAVPTRASIRQAQLDSLAKTMKGMKPDQAAAMLNKIDRDLAAEVLRRMRPADVGAVMEKLKPETAAELFATMASEEKRP
jgi:flagellar motility protein MotE (MotC chaperone)